MPNELAPCGTLSAYKRHLRKKEPTCDLCKEANRKRMNDYYKKNQEKIYAINRAWAERNPEKVKSYGRRIASKRKALKLSNGHEEYTEQEVIEKYGTKCHICNTEIDFNAPRQPVGEGWQMGLHLDHLIPLAKGGEDKIENMRPSHAVCNIKKRDN